MDARFTCPPHPPLPPISWDTQVSLHVWTNEYWGYLHSILHLHMNSHSVMHKTGSCYRQLFVWIISLSLNTSLTSFHSSEDSSTLRNLILHVIYVHRPVAPWEFSTCWFLLTYITILWTCAPDSDLTVLMCRYFSSCSMWILMCVQEKSCTSKISPSSREASKFYWSKRENKKTWSVSAGCFALW